MTNLEQKIILDKFKDLAISYGYHVEGMEQGRTDLDKVHHGIVLQILLCKEIMNSLAINYHQYETEYIENGRINYRKYNKE